MRGIVERGSDETDCTEEVVSIEAVSEVTMENVGPTVVGGGLSIESDMPMRVDGVSDPVCNTDDWLETGSSAGVDGSMGVDGSVGVDDAVGVGSVGDDGSMETGGTMETDGWVESDGVMETGS